MEAGTAWAELASGGEEAGRGRGGARRRAAARMSGSRAGQLQREEFDGAEELDGAEAQTTERRAEEAEAGARTVARAGVGKTTLAFLAFDPCGYLGVDEASV